MNKLLLLFLVLAIGLTVLTWGSVGSAALAMGLILGGIYMAVKKAMDRDPDDYFCEE